MRRTLSFLFLLLVAAGAAAQTIHAGPEHTIPPATGQSTSSQLIALLPHGDSVVAFWGNGGPLHATLLDRQGNVLTDTVIREIEYAEGYSMHIAQAGDGYLVVQGFPIGVSNLITATPLDFEFHVRGKSMAIDDDADTEPQSLACDATRCAAVLIHFIDYQPLEFSMMVLGFDGSVVTGRIALPHYSGRVTAMAHGFLTTYNEVHGALRAIFFDDTGAARHTADLGTQVQWAAGAVASGDGAIVVWPDDDALRATRVDAAGAVVETRTIATFPFEDFEEIAVACSGTECTAGVAWYYSSYVIFEGSWFPLEEIHAVRFTTALEPVDPKPVRIATPPYNELLTIAATPAGTLLGWTAFRGNAARVAFLGRGTAPYAGDVNVPGRPINSGPVRIGRIAAVRGAIAWTDFATDEQRSIRVTHIDDDGVPVEPAPAIVAQDFFNDPYAGNDVVAAGHPGVVAWRSAWNAATYARDGSPPATTPGNVEAMFTDGSESVLVLSDPVTGGTLRLLRFSGGPPAVSSVPVREFAGGGLSHGKLFLQGRNETLFLDLDRSTRVTTPATGNVYRASFAFGERYVLAFTLGDQLRLQRFAFDGHAIDAQPRVIGTGAEAMFAVPLGARFLIAWDMSRWGDGPIYAAVFDPESGALSTPSVLASGIPGRLLAGLVPRDATHAIAVFKANGVVTQLLEVDFETRHRAVRF